MDNGTPNTAGPQPGASLREMQVCIVSDGAFGERAFEQCMARFPTGFAQVDPVPPTVVDDVAIEVPPADLNLSHLRSPARALPLVEKGRPVVLGVSFDPGFVRQARALNPAVIAPEIMCSLEPTTGNAVLDTFALAFGRPAFAVTVHDGKIARLQVMRGSPCGSTVAAAAELAGNYLSPATLRHFGHRFCHHCRAPRLDRTCDRETAGLIHVRELLRALPEEAVDDKLARLPGRDGPSVPRAGGVAGPLTSREDHHG